MLMKRHTPIFRSWFDDLFGVCLVVIRQIPFLFRKAVMSKICPETGEKVIYLTCLECDTKSCKNTCRKEESDEKNK